MEADIEQSNECYSHFSKPIFIGLEKPQCYKTTDENKRLILLEIQKKLEKINTECFFIRSEICSVVFSDDGQLPSQM